VISCVSQDISKTDSFTAGWLYFCPFQPLQLLVVKLFPSEVHARQSLLMIVKTVPSGTPGLRQMAKGFSMSSNPCLNYVFAAPANSSVVGAFPSTELIQPPWAKGGYISCILPNSFEVTVVAQLRSG
jgi:hypothetical protein